VRDEVLTNPGGVLWDFVRTFLRARSAFRAIYLRYERRVLFAAKARGVDRRDLDLPPADLFRLFHLPWLEALRDTRLKPLKDLSEEIFGEGGDVGLMDAYCSHMLHECSILCEEHRSVGRFVRNHDPSRYQELFQEVSGYYPARLKRISRFFESGMLRLDELLPRWAHYRVVIRSAYLFGGPLARTAYGGGVETFYRHMHPRGGEIRGFYEAARSFRESGFAGQAVEALERSLAVGRAMRDRRGLMRDEEQALAEAEGLAAALAKEPAPR
jgi:hypothetical protein